MAQKGKSKKPLSDETKEKIRAAMTGRVLSDEWKHKISVMEAERQLNISNFKICAVCKGKRMTAGGYVWRYA